MNFYKDEEKAKKAVESHEMHKKFCGGSVSYAGFLNYNELRQAAKGWLVFNCDENECGPDEPFKDDE